MSLTATPDLIEDFIAEHSVLEATSLDRQKRHRRWLKELQARIPGGEWSGLTGDVITGWLVECIQQGMKPTTVRQRLHGTRPFVNYLHRKRVLDADTVLDIRNIRPPKGSGDGKPRPYNRQQIKRFWQEFDDKYPLMADRQKWWDRFDRGLSKWPRVQQDAKRIQMRALIAILLCGGVRREEAYKLTVDDVDPVAEYIVVHGARKNEEGESIDRAVPWTTEWMYEAVTEWVALRAKLAPGHDALWLSLHQNHRLKPMMWETFETLMRSIGSGWEFHRFRHTAATEMLRAGYALHEVQKILGHTRPEQTLRYAELLPEDVVAAAARNHRALSGALTPNQEERQ